MCDTLAGILSDMQEIRYRMEEEEEGEIELMKKLQSLESALAEGHRELAAALESSTGKKTGLMKKSESEVSLTCSFAV